MSGLSIARPFWEPMRLFLWSKCPMTSTNLSQDSHCSRREMVASLAGGLGLVGLSGMLRGGQGKLRRLNSIFLPKPKVLFFCL